MSRLVAVSNRISIPRKGTAPGGLAVGVLAAMQARGGLWFGWSGDLVDAAPQEPRLSSRGGISFATIDLLREDHELHYIGFCNGALWPLFHYFVDKFQFVDAQYAAYQRVNRLFAEQLRPLLRNDDLVWVHDYHLIPLGESLRPRRSSGWGSSCTSCFAHEVCALCRCTALCARCPPTIRSFPGARSRVVHSACASLGTGRTAVTG
jgi:trehalose-6-phosphate synthase